MSYDLEFCVARGRRPPKRRALREYFSEQSRYQVSKRKAEYYNEDTGVTFDFSWRKLDKEPVPALAEHGLVSAGTSFHINYFRSHVFALEAAMELQELVNEFDLQVDDPQIDGMAIGPYDRESFLRGWNAGNALAVHVNLNRLYDQGGSAKELNFLATAEMARCWGWNYMRRALFEQHDLQVPLIMFAREDDRVVGVVTWSDAEPIALPSFNYAILHRSSDDKLTLVSFEALTPLLKGRPLERGPAPYVIIDDDAALSRVAELLADGAPGAGELKGVPMEEMLDKDLILQALAAQADALEAAEDEPPIPLEAGFTLRIRTGEDERFIHLSDGVHNVGRHPSNEVCLDDKIADKQHVIITIDGGRGTARDNDSLAGTLVNRGRMEGVHVLTDGDEIRLGQTNIHVFVR